MQKEIFAQPQVLKETLEGRIGKHAVLEQAFGLGAKEIFDRAEAITIVACGTSFYAVWRGTGSKTSSGFLVR